jgi:cardiolipin synthase
VSEPATDQIVELALRLPSVDVIRLAAAARTGRAALVELRAIAAGPLIRQACDQLLDVAPADPTWLAGLLTGIVTARDHIRSIETVDVVWTGPTSAVETGRLTSAVVIDLIDQARTELLLVSFAAYDDKRITRAVEDAIARDVEVTVLLERNVDNPDYSSLRTALPDLDLRRLAWSGSRRPPNAALHAKLIVVDADTALVGSANLTGRAMDDNLECGVLIRGGAHPRAIRDHVWSLYTEGVLERI